MWERLPTRYDGCPAASGAGAVLCWPFCPVHDRWLCSRRTLPRTRSTRAPEPERRDQHRAADFRRQRIAQLPLFKMPDGDLMNVDGAKGAWSFFAPNRAHSELLEKDRTGHLVKRNCVFMMFNVV